LLSQARLLAIHFSAIASGTASLIAPLFRVNKALEYRASDIQD